MASALGAWLIAAHLSLILPARRRFIAGLMAVLFTCGVGLYLVRHLQVEERLFPELYVTTLAPPAFRFASPVSTERFVEEARSLKPVLDGHIDEEDRALTSR